MIQLCLGLNTIMMVAVGALAVHWLSPLRFDLLRSFLWTFGAVLPSA